LENKPDETIVDSNNSISRGHHITDLMLPLKKIKTVHCTNVRLMIVVLYGEHIMPWFRPASHKNQKGTHQNISLTTA